MKTWVLILLLCSVECILGGILFDVVCDCSFSRPSEKYALGDKIDIGISRRRSLVRYFTFQNDTMVCFDPYCFPYGCTKFESDKDIYYLAIESAYVKPGGYKYLTGNKNATILGASLGTAAFLCCVCICVIIGIKYGCCAKRGLKQTTKEVVEKSGKTRMQLMMERNV